MEVHHHSHTARKKWTHYFWEFLMLFLAVFCGFLAENKREHIVEQHRAKEFAKTLVADLSADTTELLDVIREDKIRWLEVPDSLMNTHLPLQSDNPELLNEFANSFETRRRVLNLLINRDYTEALAAATELIGLLKEEYHLEKLRVSK